MGEHEELHERHEREANELEHESDQLGKHIDEARAANERLESDQLIPTPEGDEGDEGQQPPPEAEYPAKD